MLFKSHLTIMSKSHATILQRLEQILITDNIIITTWCCHKLGKISKDIVLLKLHIYSFMAATILHLYLRL